MATVLSEFEFTRRNGKGRTGHPWHQWLDGRIWQLELGKDFHGKPQGLIANAYQKAKKMGVKLKSSRLDNGAVVLQAYTDPAKPKLDLRSAEETYERLRQAGGDSWDNIDDPEKHIGRK